MEEKKSSLFDKVKEDMLMDVVEQALPKIQPFLVPAMEKMNEWFGEDEKLIVIRKSKGQSTKVIIFDNKNGNYKIEKSSDKNTFEAYSKESIIGVYDISEFVTKMISGDLTKMIG